MKKKNQTEQTQSEMEKKRRQPQEIVWLYTVKWLIFRIDNVNLELNACLQMI